MSSWKIIGFIYLLYIYLSIYLFTYQTYISSVNYILHNCLGTSRAIPPIPLCLFMEDYRVYLFICLFIYYIFIYLFICLFIYLLTRLTLSSVNYILHNCLRTSKAIPLLPIFVFIEGYRVKEGVKQNPSFLKSVVKYSR